MFNEHDFVDRVDAAAACGFAAVECQFPYETAPEDLRARLDATGLTLELLNAPPGDVAAGDRGLASLDGRHEDFVESMQIAARYAEAVGCSRIHVLAGCPTDGGATQRFVDRLGWAADLVANAEIDIMIEPMNLRDVPGYLLMSSKQAERVITQVGRSNLKLQFDTYHLQIQEGDVLESFTRCLPVIGHVQCSSLPGRHEPDRGELNHEWLFQAFDHAGYEGWIGCEYQPASSTLDGLGWGARWGLGPNG